MKTSILIFITIAIMLSSSLVERNQMSLTVTLARKGTTMCLPHNPNCYYHILRCPKTQDKLLPIPGPPSAAGVFLLVTQQTHKLSIAFFFFSLFKSEA